MEEGRIAFKMLTGTPTGKKPLGRPRCRWKDDIRMDLKNLVSIWGFELIRLKTGIVEEALWMRHWTSGLHKPWSYLVWNQCITSPIGKNLGTIDLWRQFRKTKPKQQDWGIVMLTICHSCIEEMIVHIWREVRYSEDDNWSSKSCRSTNDYGSWIARYEGKSTLRKWADILLVPNVSQEMFSWKKCYNVEIPPINWHF